LVFGGASLTGVPSPRSGANVATTLRVFDQ
jgi:hypothetical protein